MDVLNFISWIKNGQQVTTVDPTQTLIPLGLRDPRRDDGYRSGTITAQDFINSVAPPAIIEVGVGCNSTQRTGVNSSAFGAFSVVLGKNSCATAISSTVSGGESNAAVSNCGTVAGGAINTVYNDSGAISGGEYNNIFGFNGTIGGGSFNSVNGQYGVVAGGTNNSAGSCGAAVLGGAENYARGCFAVIGGGRNNLICFGTCFNTILSGCSNIIANDNRVNIVGSNITSNRSCTTFVNNLSIMDIPTSSAGLPSKSVWSNAGVLTIVP
jgi:hypothetical protein